MRTGFHFFIITLLTLLLFHNFIYTRDSTLIEFQLKDQFDRTWSNNDFSGYVTIVVGSDRKGSQYNETWSFAIYDSLVKYELADSVKFLAVADVRGVPSLFKKLVKKKFPREPERWIILDWEGKFARAYGFVSAESNIILVNRSGKIFYQLSVKMLDRDTLDTLLKNIYREFSFIN